MVRCTKLAPAVVKTERSVYIKKRHRWKFLVSVYTSPGLLSPWESGLTLCHKGRNYCPISDHHWSVRFSLQDCTFGDSTVWLSCTACLTRQGEERQAVLDAARARAVEHTLPRDDADGFQSTEIGDFENMFAHGTTGLMDVDLPVDTALSQREAAQLEKLNKKINEIEFNSCIFYLEEGFDLSVVDGTCSRCRCDCGPRV